MSEGLGGENMIAHKTFITEPEYTKEELVNDFIESCKYAKQWAEDIKNGTHEKQKDWREHLRELREN